MRLVEIDFAAEMGEGEARTLAVGEGDNNKVLIAKYQDKLYATGNKCSHVGFSLGDGMVFDDKIVCPAHTAAFSIISGQPEAAPGLDGIPTYPVINKDGKWFVEVPEGELQQKVTMPMTKRDPENP